MTDTSWSQEKLPGGKNRCPRCNKIHDINSNKIAPPKKAVDPGQRALQAFMEKSGSQTVHLRCPHCGATYMLTHNPDARETEGVPTDTQLANTLNAMSGPSSPTKALEQTRDIGDRRKCPACAELIKIEANVCHFCGCKFTTEEVTQAHQENQAKVLMAEVATQQTERAAQQQRQVRRLKGRHTRRRVFGTILTWFGGFCSVAMVAMFFSDDPSHGTTTDQQKIAAITTGVIFGLIPLLGGIALLRAAKSVRIALLAEDSRLAANKSPPVPKT